MGTVRTTCTIALSGALLLAGCEEPPKTASGRSMSAPAEAPTAAAREEGPNEPPRVVSLSITPSEPMPRQVVQAQASVQDPDGDSTHLRFTWRVNGELLAATGASLPLPDLAKDASIEVQAVASDGRSESAPAFARATIGNRAPVISEVRFDRADEVRAGDPLVAVVAAEDPDGDDVELSYRWTVNDRVVELDADTSRFDTSSLKRGDQIAVRVVASDGDDDSEAFAPASLVLGNGAPKITSTPPPVMGADGIYRYAVEASDPDRDRSLRYELSAGPDGARVDPVSGEITWTPTFQQTGTHPIEVLVRDGHGGETKQRFEVTVKAVVEGAAAAEQPPASEAPEAESR